MKNARPYLGFAVLLLAITCPARAAYQPEPAVYCQILDSVQRPVYDLGLTFVAESDYEQYGSAAQVELDAYWEMLFYRNVLRADFDLDLGFSTTVFLDSAGIDLPDQVIRLNLDAGMTWRFINRNALEVRLLPGIYSDIDQVGSGGFAFPFSVSGIRTFNSRFSGLIGAEVRPGFRREVIALIGIVWEVSDAVRLDLRLPRSRLSWSITGDWSTYLDFDWENTSYKLSEKGSVDRERMTLDDLRLRLGVAHRLSEQFQLTAELGSAFSRSVEFEKESGESDNFVDVENGIFVRFALGGGF